MKTRFDGEQGKRRLIEALVEQRLVEHRHDLASALADAGVLVEFATGTPLVEQGAVDNDIFFLVDGNVDVLVNGRPVAQREACDCIGEMAALSPAAARSATVVATRPVLALKVAEPDFQSIATQYPTIWRPIARTLATRLREREKFHRLPNPSPVVFIGSSVEGLPVAREIESGLKHDNVVCRVWSAPGVFGPGGISVDVLQKEAESADFAVFVFGPDDRVGSREQEYQAPRDNVVFELGLFMGQMNRERALVVTEHGADVKIPSDLLGIGVLTYKTAPASDLAARLGPVCNELRKLFKNNGPR